MLDLVFAFIFTFALNNNMSPLQSPSCSTHNGCSICNIRDCCLLNYNVEDLVVIRWNKEGVVGWGVNDK